MSTSPTPNPEVPNPESNPDIHQAASTQSTQDTPGSSVNDASSVNPQDPNVAPVVTDNSVNTPDTLSNQPKDNQIPLSNETQPRQVPVNENANINSTDTPIGFQDEPTDPNASSQVPEDMQSLFKDFEDRTGKRVEVFQYSEESKKADIRIEGYSARQTQQVIVSNPAITYSRSLLLRS
jgi:hypothetical protein